MSHGFHIMGVGPSGMAIFAAATGFLYYLSRSFQGPEEAKFLVDPFVADVAKEYQPGLHPEFYYNKKKDQP